MSTHDEVRLQKRREAGFWAVVSAAGLALMLGFAALVSGCSARPARPATPPTAGRTAQDPAVHTVRRGPAETAAVEVPGGQVLVPAGLAEPARRWAADVLALGGVPPGGWLKALEAADGRLSAAASKADVSEAEYMSLALSHLDDIYRPSIKQAIRDAGLTSKLSHAEWEAVERGGLFEAVEMIDRNHAQKAVVVPVAGGKLILASTAADPALEPFRRAYGDAVAADMVPAVSKFRADYYGSVSCGDYSKATNAGYTFGLAFRRVLQDRGRPIDGRALKVVDEASSLIVGLPFPVGGPAR